MKKIFKLLTVVGYPFYILAIIFYIAIAIGLLVLLAKFLYKLFPIYVPAVEMYIFSSAYIIYKNSRDGSEKLTSFFSIAVLIIISLTSVAISLSQHSVTITFILSPLFGTILWLLIANKYKNDKKLHKFLLYAFCAINILITIFAFSESLFAILFSFLVLLIPALEMYLLILLIRKVSKENIVLRGCFPVSTFILISFVPIAFLLTQKNYSLSTTCLYMPLIGVILWALAFVIHKRYTVIKEKKKILNFDWELSPPHLFLLTTFLLPRTESDIPSMSLEDWKSALGENLNIAIQRFMEVGMLGIETIPVRLDRKYTTNQLKQILKNKGVLARGTKDELINKVISQYKEETSTLVDDFVLLRCTEKGRRVAEEYIQIVSKEDAKELPRKLRTPAHKLKDIIEFLILSAGSGIVGNRADDFLMNFTEPNSAIFENLDKFNSATYTHLAEIQSNFNDFISNGEMLENFDFQFVEPITESIADVADNYVWWR